MKNATLIFAALCACFLAFAPAAAQAQRLFGNPEPSRIREGNQQYEKGQFPAAELAYRTASEAAPESFRAAFNLGDALYRQQQFEPAAREYQRAAQLAKSQPERADALHNLGNALAQQQRFPEAAEAYKQSLRQQPGRPDTQYNLAYALSQMQPQDNNRQNQQNNDQQRDGRDNKNSEDKDSPNKETNREDTPEGQKQNKPQPQPGVSKQEIDRMLEALKGQEEEVQKKMLRQKNKAAPRSQEKDW